ncbi:hypothetical protein ACTVBU_10720 [Sanguibacter sp. A246]|uniref:hypothetical protein n=1 Tax=Sanguibacter sp. A246 TaxID=3457326 RepID=UPI003FD8A6BD
MSILSDAELVLGLSRHLSAYAMTPERAALGNLEFAGQYFEMAFRLRGSTTSPAARVKAIATDASLAPRTLWAVLSTMESSGWISVNRDEQGQPLSVNEQIPPISDLVDAGPTIVAMVAADEVERAALQLLRATSLQPLVIEDALHDAAAAAGGDSEAAEAALRHLTGVHLIRKVCPADGEREVLYNPNVWTQGDEVAGAALKAADAKATSEVRALLEEVANNPGMPEAHVTSTEPRWVAFAVTQGLVQRSVIQTSESKEQGFLFTPHLARDPFGKTGGDASGQVRQMVGSMVYAATFAQYKLHSPTAFLSALIDRGVAGDVSSIRTDYPMLEKAGIVRVVAGSSANKGRLELLQAEVAEEALTLLTARDPNTGAPAASVVLSGQRGYVHVERERARLAVVADTDDLEQARLLAALREVTTRRAMGGTK